MQESGEYKEDELFGMMAAFFAIFFIDDTNLASWDAGFLRHALDILVNLFKRVGLQKNTSKTLTMICTPGRAIDGVVQMDATWTGDGFGVELSRRQMQAVRESAEGKLSWPPPGRCP